MGWDTERTRSLLLAAGVAEFSARGCSGARVDQIALTAGVNKERIYQYFGNKRGLFDAVIESELVRVMDRVPLHGEGVDAVADYAGSLFDHHLAHPELARLMFWEGLECGTEVVSIADRRESSAEKIRAIRRVLPGATAEAAAELLLTIFTLCNAWIALPQLDRVLTDDEKQRNVARRAAIVELARAAAEKAATGA